MTREQYEKLKEYIEARIAYSRTETEEVYGFMTMIEKELDKLMFPEGNGE